jgi:hypothetical protein
MSNFTDNLGELPAVARESVHNGAHSPLPAGMAPNFTILDD